MSATEVASESVKTSDHAVEEIAPFYLARVGGVSAQQLGGLSLTRTAEEIGIATAAESEMGALAVPVEEALYRLVPQTGEDQELRRRVLRVKRHVHNLRLWTEAAADLDAVAAALTDGIEREMLWQWHRLAVERDAALGRAADNYQREAAAAARTLADSMRDPDLQAGIAIASPDALTEILRSADEYRPEDWRPASKLARSSLAYLSRAALKTSPLSTFTQLAVATSERGVAEHSILNLHPAPGTRNVVRLVRTLPLSWLMLVARDRELAAALSFEPNAGLSLRPDEGKISVLTTDYAVHGSFAARIERVADRKFDQSRLPVLARYLEGGRALSHSELLSLIAEAGISPDPHLGLIRLLDTQLVRPVAPSSQCDARPLVGLARALARLEGRRAVLVSTLMRGVQNAADSCRRADGAARLKLFGKIQQAAALVFEALGSEPPEWLSRVGLIYEDVRFDGAPITLGRDVREELAAVARELRPKIIRSHLYDFIYGHFLRRFGPRGETDDILGFLQDFLAREDLAELLNRAVAEDSLALRGGGAGARSDLSAGKSATPPAVSVFFQIAAESEEALGRGDYRLVVNETGGGQGGLLGRFADLLGPGDGDLAARLSAWVNSGRGELPALELTAIGDWNNLHPVLGVTGKVLKWPAECPTTEAAERGVETVQLRDLRLRADAADETLYFVDRTGRVVSPCYLGLVPPVNFRGALGMLLFLIDPWVGESEVGGRRDRRSVPLAPPSGVEFYPRRESGRVVLRRARWRFPISEIPVRRKGEVDFDFFLRVRRWRHEHGLPEEVFAAVERNAVEFDPKYRKPVWVNFGSPHSLELLRQILVADAPAVTLTEALPTPGEHWVPGPGGDADDRRVSEFIALVRWPMPDQLATQPVAEVNIQGQVARADRQDQWLYYKLYPAKLDQLEDVVRRIVGPAKDAVRAAGGLRRWFFVRYIDREGAHVRMRFKVSPERGADASRAIEELIAREMPAVQSLPVPPLFPLDDAAFQARELAPHYAAAEYQPEYEKYGGSAGVEIAERLFEISSELALKVVSSGQDLWPLRESLCLRMTRDLVRKFHPGAEAQADFLRNYLWYWSGQDYPGAFGLRARFEETAGHRAAQLSEQFNALGRHPLLGAAADDYREAIEATARELDRADIPVPRTRLCFDYVHMNNNRLGVKPVEEAYLAALLAAAL